MADPEVFEQMPDHLEDLLVDDEVVVVPPVIEDVVSARDDFFPSWDGTSSWVTHDGQPIPRRAEDPYDWEVDGI